ncbi:hypothetical protein Tco_0047976, partial [Tanacetum coccineum]
VEVYENKDNARKDEIEATLGGQTAMFYHLLKEIREYYRCHPTAQAINNLTDKYEQQLQRELPQIRFSGEARQLHLYCCVDDLLLLNILSKSCL